MRRAERGPAKQPVRRDHQGVVQWWMLSLPIDVAVGAVPGRLAAPLPVFPLRGASLIDRDLAEESGVGEAPGTRHLGIAVSLPGAGSAGSVARFKVAVGQLAGGLSKARVQGRGAKIGYPAAIRQVGDIRVMRVLVKAFLRRQDKRIGQTKRYEGRRDPRRNPSLVAGHDCGEIQRAGLRFASNLTRPGFSYKP